jgi:hypothetical protein
MLSRTVVRIDLTLLATLLLFKVSYGVTLLSMRISTFMLILAGTNSTLNLLITL